MSKDKESHDEDDLKHSELQPNDKSSVILSKPKDKHNKLRETIEKLKAKSEICNKLKVDEFGLDLEPTKENKDRSRKDKEDKLKQKKNKSNIKSQVKKDLDFEDSNSTGGSLIFEKKKEKKNNSKISNNKNASLDALNIATEQTLKDINKWLDDTPKFSEFSSASNSPSYTTFEDFDVGNKIENDVRKKIDKVGPKKDGFGKDIKRRMFSRDPSKFLKRREVQRTIDRLQPGKSKGNLISSVQNNAKAADDVFSLGLLSKTKDTKNSLIVKTDDNAPKLSLGSVLDSFGRHKFVDDTVKVEDTTSKAKDLFSFQSSEVSKETKEEIENKIKADVGKKEPPPSGEESSMMSGATPNLSAWFRAFGAPKVQSTQKKTDAKTDNKESESSDVRTKEELNTTKTSVPEISPNTDSPIAVSHGQPIPRQRKISTGSSVSERSSFSQDMDSPRVGIDERLGAYPAPYPSPLHRSPSGASPIMVSPRADASPKATPYPSFNGQMRVGFYQDTVSNKSSPDKSCSPRDNPQSPYVQASEHVYPPNTTQNVAYSYPNSPYYSHVANYSNTNPTSYNSESINPNSYYDTNKSLTDQYQAKNYANTPSQLPHSTVDAFRQDEQNQKINEKMTQNAVFPVKKRAYSEADPVHPNMQRYEKSDNQISNPNESSQIPDSAHRYIHQNIPEPKSITVLSNVEAYPKSPTCVSAQQIASPIINYSTASNPYGSNYSNESNYSLSIPTARSLGTTPTVDRKLDISKYSNVGYGNSDNFSRNNQQYDRPDMYTRLSSADQPNCSNQQSIQSSDALLHYTNSMSYKGVDMNPATSNSQQAHTQYNNSSSSNSRLAQPLETQQAYKSNEVSIPRPTYNTSLEMDQPLGLRGNISNLSHIPDRYNNDERMLAGLQPPVSQYYGEKAMTGPPMFNKPINTTPPVLPIFSQANIDLQNYNQNMQAASASMYSRQMANELQNSEAKNTAATSLAIEKKSKKRKTAKVGKLIAFLLLCKSIEKLLRNIFWLQHYVSVIDWYIILRYLFFCEL